MKSIWTSVKLFRRIAETGEHPADIGRNGGLRQALIRRQKKEAMRKDALVEKQWWNK